MRALIPLVFVVTLAALPLAGHAQWKWRDGQGRVTVSDRPPPPEVPSKDILTRPPGSEPKARAAVPTAAASAPADGAAPAPTKTAANNNVDPELEARKKKADQEEAAKVKEAEDKRAAEMRENCQRARSQMASLDSGMRITRVNEKGEREVLDDAQRAAETARTREAIAANCK
jgi:Domain of unknown function (DUF4124)